MSNMGNIVLLRGHTHTHMRLETHFGIFFGTKCHRWCDRDLFPLYVFDTTFDFDWQNGNIFSLQVALAQPSHPPLVLRPEKIRKQWLTQQHSSSCMFILPYYFQASVRGCMNLCCFWKWSLFIPSMENDIVTWYVFLA